MKPVPLSFRTILCWLTPNGGILLIVLILLLNQPAWAQPSQNLSNFSSQSTTSINVTSIPYQGRLTDAQGDPLNSPVNLTFKLYDAVSDNVVVWGPEIHNSVPVSNGVFNVTLGSLTVGGIPIDIWTAERYLEIAVNGETLTPRKPIFYGTAISVKSTEAGTVPFSALDSRHVQLASGYQKSTGTTPLSETGWIEVPNTFVTLAPETDQTFIVTIVADLRVTDGTVVAQLFVDDVGLAGQAVFRSATGTGRGTVSQVYRVDLSAGTHTMVVKAHLNSGTSGDISGMSTITWFAISQ